MKLTVLVENSTLIDKYLLGEPGLSFLLEADGKKILFDTGYSDVFIENSKRMEISLEDLDYIVISHGHNDHVGGLHLLRADDSRVNKTVDYLKAQNLDVIYPCHCTGFDTICKMYQSLNVKSIGAGSEIELF